MSAIFPRDAVVKRYLNTGARPGTPRKVVIGAFLGGALCAFVVAGFPGSNQSGNAAPSGPQADAKRTADGGCKEHPWMSTRCADAPERTGTPVAAVAPVPATQPIAEKPAPAPIAAQTKPAPATEMAAASAPVLPAEIKPAPAPEPTVQAAVVPPPTAEPPRPTASESIARKVAAKKAARKAALASRLRVEKRIRAARLQEQRDVPQSAMRASDVPDGGLFYQRAPRPPADIGFGGDPSRRFYRSPPDDFD